jgi:hypothetical protein
MGERQHAFALNDRRINQMHVVNNALHFTKHV